MDVTIFYNEGILKLEPEDENPPAEEEEREGDEPPLDSEDDVSDDDELATFESALPPGMSVAPAPSQVQLEFKNAAGKDLKDRLIMFNWAALGWWCGRIRRPSGAKDKMVKVDGVRLPANFIVAYEDGEGRACLTLNKYGKGALRDAEWWVLLVEAEVADTTSLT